MHLTPCAVTWDRHNMVPVGYPADCSHSIITPMLNDAHSLMRTNTHTNRCAYVYVLVWSGGVFVDASVFIELDSSMYVDVETEMHRFSVASPI